MKLKLITYIFFLQIIFSADGGFSGTVYNESSEPLPGANVYLKDTNIGTSTDINGEFFIGNIQEGKYTLEIDFIGYKKVSKDYVISGEKNQFLEKLNLNDGQSDERTIERDFYLDLSFYLEPKSITSSQVDVKGHQLNQKLSDISKMAIFGPSRVRESYLSVGASVDRVSIRDIRMSAALNFYEGLDYLKEIEAKQVSVLFTTLNVRGKGVVDVREYTQLVDGAQSTEISYGGATGNISGLSEIDVANVELLHGAASVMYGPYSTSGMILITSKTPWFYKGSSFQIKTGLNYKQGTETTPFQHVAYRYAKSFDKFAYKIVVSDKRATEWVSPKDSSYIKPSLEQDFSTYNLVNFHGDDIELNSEGITGCCSDPEIINFPIARTAYWTGDLKHDKVYNTKLNTSLRYKFNNDIELVYDVKGGWAEYTRTAISTLHNKDSGGWNQSLTVTGENWMTRLYIYTENENPFVNNKQYREYDLRELAIYLQEYSKPNDIWYQDYLAAYAGYYILDNDTIPFPYDVISGNHQEARNFADSHESIDTENTYYERLKPGTSDFKSQMNDFINQQIDDFSGQNKFTNIEFIYDFTESMKYFGLQAGGSYRKYFLGRQGSNPISNQEEIVNQFGEITPVEFALFLQTSKRFLDEKLKLKFALRYDSSTNFGDKISPSFTSVYKVNENQFIRSSFQHSALNPSAYWAYLNVPQTNFTAIGGSKDNLMRTGLDQLHTNLIQFVYDENRQLVLNEYGIPDTIHKFVPYPSPERVTSLELGYKALIDNNILIDLNYFYNHRENIRDDSNFGFNPAEYSDWGANGVFSPGMYYYVYSHSEDLKETIHGISISGAYNFENGAIINGSYDFIDDIGKLERDLSTQQGYVGISRPKNRYKLSLKHPNAINNNIGYSLTARYNEKYWFDSYIYHGIEEVDAHLNIDAQLSYVFSDYHLMLKSGVNNLLNVPYKTTVNAQEIGTTIYLTIEYDLLIK